MLLHGLRHSVTEGGIHGCFEDGYVGGRRVVLRLRAHRRKRLTTNLLRVFWCGRAHLIIGDDVDGKRGKVKVKDE